VKAKNSDKEVKFLRIVQLPLMPDMVTEIQRMVINKPELEHLFFAQAAEGYAMTLKPNPRGGFSASAMQASPESVNAGKMVFGNGADEYLAAASVLLKVEALNSNVDWDTVESSLGGSIVS